MAQLIFGTGFGVFLQQVTEQVVVRINVRVFLQPLGPVCFEGRLGLDVRNTAHPGVYAKAKITVLIQFLVQILFARHPQLIADRLFPADLHLDAGVAVAVFFTGHHADLHGISSGRDRLYKGRCILQLHQRIAGKDRSAGKMDGADVQHIHFPIPNHFLCEMSVQVCFAGQFVFDGFIFVQPLCCRHFDFSFLFQRYPDDGPVKVIVAVQRIILLHFRLAVGRAGQETKERSQPAADIAPAVAAAGGEPVSLYHFPHIGIVGDGQAEEVGFLHVIGPVLILIHVLKPVQTHGVV